MPEQDVYVNLEDLALRAVHASLTTGTLLITQDELTYLHYEKVTAGVGRWEKIVRLIAESNDLTLPLPRVQLFIPRQ